MESVVVANLYYRSRVREIASVISVVILKLLSGSFDILSLFLFPFLISMKLLLGFVLAVNFIAVAYLILGSPVGMFEF